MIEIDPAVVSFVILKAREFDVKVDPVAAEADSEDDELAILENYADDPTFQEVHDFIEGLNVSEQRNLVELMWIGRGDFWAEDGRTPSARPATGRPIPAPTICWARPCCRTTWKKGCPPWVMRPRTWKRPDILHSKWRMHRPARHELYQPGAAVAQLVEQLICNQ